MKTTTLRTALVCTLLALTSCNFHPDNPLYCDGHPDDPMCSDGGVDTDTANGCSSNDQCASPTPVCDVAGSRACVECMAPDDTSECSGSTPVCGSDKMCRACTAHSECASNVCRPDGSCSDGNDVAFVDPSGTDNDTCTMATPCTKVAKALTTARPFVKLRGTTSEQVTINNQNVTLLADPGAKLTSSSTGIILRVDGTSVVTIEDLTIADGLGSGGIGVSMQPGNTATLTLRRTTISGNAGGGISASGGSLTAVRSKIVNNTGGGISVSSAQFDITNNVIAGNGGPSPSNTVGGINFAVLSSAGKLEFNTITSNAGGSGVNSGVNCGTVTVAMTFGNNIIYGNLVSGGGKQFGGSSNCATAHSDVGPDAVTGTGNINMDPQFVNAGQGNYHLMSTSPCIDAADPAATLNVDVDGDARPKGAGRDIGADEVQ